MTTNAIFFDDVKEITTEKLYQYDICQKLKISGFDINENTEVHFKSPYSKIAKIATGTLNGSSLTVVIPDEFLENAGNGKVWVCSIDENEVTTIRTINIPIAERAKPDGYVSKADGSYRKFNEEIADLNNNKANKEEVSAEIANAKSEAITAADSMLDDYDKTQVQPALAKKADLIATYNIFDFNSWAKGLQSLTTPVYSGTLNKVDYINKSISFTTTKSGGYTNGWTSSAPQSMRIAVKPNTNYSFSWAPSSINCGAFVFLNGTNTTATRFELKKGSGSFTTAEDTTYILIRFDYYGVGFFKVSEIMIAEKESIYLPNKVAEGVTEVANKVSALAKATQSALNKKYDSSNFESGTGTLAPTKDIYAGCEGSFVYAKNGNIVTVSVNITVLPSGKNYIQMSGLPYAAKIESKLSSFAVYSTANKLINIRLDGSWIYVSSTDKFAEGEKINFIITYIIR